jgi:predicted anti-sigma-YlaC factor YlaD
MAVNSLGNALAGSSSTYARDDDPELVRQALPFGLKTIEALLDEAPTHEGLLLAAASGFTQYSFAFVEQEADFEEAKDLAAATALRERAVKLYLRARDYGFRGLEVKAPGFRERLRADPATALGPLKKKQVPLIYWTAASWAAAMALSKSNSSLSADQGLTEAMMSRALQLDETYALGAIHDFFIVYEGGRYSVGGSVARAREHLQRALEIAQGRRAWPYVDFAETASVGTQNRKEFEDLLHKAFALDPNRDPDQRLSNLLAQRRAQWLLSRTDELFVE